MAFQTPITIKEAIENVHQKKYLLPAIQREFVWSEEQIERLFDSLLQHYPIGSFLFWQLDNERIRDYQFYEFIRNYHERDRKHNDRAHLAKGDNITAILDGQQRLTALYIALKGSYASKLAWKRRSNDDAYPERFLYLNLRSPSKVVDMKYDFQFLSREDAEKQDKNTFWFPVSEMLNMASNMEVNNYLMEHELMAGGGEQGRHANESLFTLHQALHQDRVINYYLEKGNDIDKVLNMFIRVNSGGTPLSYSDLLLSIATAQWEEKDAREEINNFVESINAVGNGFNFDKDFILKSCLVLTEFKDIAFKVKNFNKANMLAIEKKWDAISNAISLAVRLVASFGFNQQTLVSANALIPIAYYLHKIEAQSSYVDSPSKREDREKIKTWLIHSLLKRAFSGVPDNVLRPIRQVIDENHQEFPFDQIVDKFRGQSKSIQFTTDDIDALFQLRYGKGYTFAVLALLYPWVDLKNLFHQDHIFPKSHFSQQELSKRGIDEDDQQFYRENFDCLGNLQLLEGSVNQAKQDMPFDQWLKTNFKGDEQNEFCRKNYIPGIDLSFENFGPFIEQRQKLIREKLAGILVMSEVGISAEEENEMEEVAEEYASEDEAEIQKKPRRSSKRATENTQGKKPKNSKQQGEIIKFMREVNSPVTMDQITNHMKGLGFKSKTYYDICNACVKADILGESEKDGKKTYYLRENEILSGLPADDEATGPKADQLLNEFNEHVESNPKNRLRAKLSFAFRRTMLRPIAGMTCNQVIENKSKLTDWVLKYGGKRGGKLSERSATFAWAWLARAYEYGVAKGKLTDNPLRSYLPRNPRSGSHID